MFEDYHAPALLCGYSLGSSLAMLHALACCRRGVDPPAHVVLIAPPKTGDRNFTELYDERFAERTISFANRLDLVCSMPFGASYVHAGGIVQLSFRSRFFNHDYKGYRKAIEEWHNDES